MSYSNCFEIIKSTKQHNSYSSEIQIQDPINKHDAHVTRSEDWQLRNIAWTVDTSQGFFKDNTPKYIVDPTTGKRYLNEDRMVVRLKCIYPGLVFIPLLSIGVGAFNIAYRLIKVLSGYHLWGNLEEEKLYKFTAKIQTGNTITQQTFQARFDDLKKINKLINTENLKLSSIKNDKEDLYTLIVKTNQGEEVTIKAIENKHYKTTNEENEENEERITLSDLQVIKETYDLEKRFLNCLKDIARIAASFIIILPLTISALYGLWKPYEARKLISSIALSVCGTDQVAACFAPSPSFHALGGNINTHNSF